MQSFFYIKAKTVWKNISKLAVRFETYVLKYYEILKLEINWKTRNLLFAILMLSYGIHDFHQ